ARSSLQTGKYPEATGCWRNNIHLPVDEKTVAHWLTEWGYQTAYVGKWHLASGPEPERNYREQPVPKQFRGGWDWWCASDVLEFTSHSYDGHMFWGDGSRYDFPEGRYRVDAVTDVALQFLQERDRDRPFVLFVSYIEPHHQNDHNRYEGPHGSQEQWADYEVPGDLVGTEGDWRENFADYLGCCNALDGALGRIRGALDEDGIADETVVLYTSDHGSHFKTRNSEYKRACHDGCLHIPMVATGPGFTGGGVVSEIVSLIDAPPTLLHAAGIPAPESYHGRALQPLVARKAQDWPREAFAQISESQTGRCIRTPRWTYSVSIPDSGPRSDLYFEEYLYDNAADPHQRENLVRDGDHADVRAELAEVLIRRMTEAGESGPEIRPAAQ
ncbi:MAG: sulfatase-like hydrolase/transferase, partial [candidate division WS1 bacterium]|nr:sulfatase-like hydrolase/transferase [candidate division WS1 bacterium]